MSGILVTGASRGLGRYLVERMDDAGLDVTAMVRKATDVTRLMHEWRGRSIRLALADVTNRESLDAALKGHDALVHAAAAVGSDQHDRKTAYRINVEGTANLWRAAPQAGVGRSVLVSSVAVYGRPNVPEVAEDAPRAGAHSVDNYEATKAAAEDVAFALGQQLHFQTVVLRPSVVWGPYDTQFVPRVMTGLAKGSFIYVGDPDRPINVCAAEHVYQCTRAALETAGLDGEAFNVVDGQLPSWRQAVELIARVANLPPPTRQVSRKAALALGTVADAVRTAGIPLGLPALTRFGARVAGTPCVYRIDKATQRLGYRPTLQFLRDGEQAVRAALSNL